MPAGTVWEALGADLASTRRRPHRLPSADLLVEVLMPCHHQHFHQHLPTPRPGSCAP